MENNRNGLEWLKEYQTSIRTAIDTRFTERYSEQPTCESERLLRESVRYALESPGKRIRPVLFLLWYEIASWMAHTPEIAKIACGLECVHAYTLVHDDLPCMDNDELRRWMPTVWKAYGEYQAVLTGDALQSMWFEWLCWAGNIDILRRVSRMAWDLGIVLGQAKDMDSTNSVTRIEDLELLHREKTGWFLRESIACGGILGGASTVTLNALETYGEAVGLAFQIRDDIIDATIGSETAGKKTGKDGEKGYVHFLWLEEAKAHLAKVTEKALESAIELRSDKLQALAGYIAKRQS